VFLVAKGKRARCDWVGDDAAFISHALGVIARAKGMAQLAKDTGLGRESLYKALSSEGNPSFATILKAIKALGLRLESHPVAHVCSAWLFARRSRQPPGRTGSGRRRGLRLALEAGEAHRC